MQVRFDGYLGFPGGFIDSGESPEDGLNRELMEEIGLDLSKHRLSKTNWLSSYIIPEKKIILYFYMFKMELNDFISLERNVLRAEEYGLEVGLLG